MPEESTTTGTKSTNKSIQDYKNENSVYLETWDQQINSGDIAWEYDNS